MKKTVTLADVRLRKGETPNETTLRLGDLTLYFSYETIVAFEHRDRGLVVSMNAWSMTTGKHLNRIDGGSASAKRNRLDREEFEVALTEVLHSCHLVPAC